MMDKFLDELKQLMNKYNAEIQSEGIPDSETGKSVIYIWCNNISYSLDIDKPLNEKTIINLLK